MKLNDKRFLIHINTSNSAMLLVNKSNIMLIILFYSQDITTFNANVDSVCAFLEYEAQLVPPDTAFADLSVLCLSRLGHRIHF
jgi:hypothetical protein